MPDRVYKFAQFELNFASGELRSGNSTVRLQEKALLLLGTLLDHSQQLVTREQLRERMWDRRTVVDFGQGINVAVGKVRDALGDSAENPRFIETVATRGYRFLVPVSVIAASPALPRPEAAPPDAVATPAAVDARQRWHRWVAAGGILCALAIGLAFALIRSGPQRTVPIRSLAVLPLQDLSPEPGQEYFADGITEDVITNLAQTLPLRVVSRTSVMRYKHTDKPVAQIARELGVEAIVEGAVARSQDRVSVTVQLIDATEDRHLWAQKYERRLGDTMAVESELSQAIATRVSGTLTPRPARLASSRPVDAQVYELCLLGRYHLNKRIAAELTLAEGYFRQAADRDPTYAPAYVGLADVYALQPHFGPTALQVSLAKAAAAARRAVELDDGLAEAHAILGLIALHRNPEWEHADVEFRRAIELNPNDATVHLWYAYYQYFVDRPGEALAEVERARELDPLSAMIVADDGHFLYAERQFEAARARLRQAMELAPDLAQPHETLALIELESGHADAALREARAGLALDSGSARTIGEAGYVLASTGHTAEAEELLAKLEGLVRRDAALPMFVSLVEVGLGQREAALRSLDEQVAIGLHGLGQWHAFDQLSSDARFQKLLTVAP